MPVGNPGPMGIGAPAQNSGRTAPLTAPAALHLPVADFPRKKAPDASTVEFLDNCVAPAPGAEPWFNMKPKGAKS
jgi:hypothetical protein